MSNPVISEVIAKLAASLTELAAEIKEKLAARKAKRSDADAE